MNRSLIHGMKSGNLARKGFSQSFHQADRDGGGGFRLAGDSGMVGCARSREKFFADQATTHTALGSKDLASRVHASVYVTFADFVRL
jgi:hypothetical protein